MSDRPTLNDVYGTVTYVQEAFEDYVRDVLPGTSVIFDDQLSYRTAIEALRRRDNNQGQITDALPMLAYKRTNFVSEENALGRRARSKAVCATDEDGTWKYKVGYGTFDILFFYFTKDIELLEKFESAYLAECGLAQDKSLDVRFPRLGDFKYFMDYSEDLTDLSIEDDEGNFYKGIGGLVKVRGFTFTLLEAAKTIGEINAQFISSSNLAVEGNDEILSTCPIVGTND